MAVKNLNMPVFPSFDLEDYTKVVHDGQNIRNDLQTYVLLYMSRTTSKN